MNENFKFLAKALNNLAGAIWIVDPAMSETYFVNSKFRELLGLSNDIDYADINVEECVGRLGYVFDSADWREGNMALAMTRLRETPSFEVVLPTQDGRHIRLNRYPDSDGCAVINFTDVTELVLISERAKEAEIAKTAFLANMSHEIRTPMNGVVGMTQVLASTNLDEKQKNYVELIARSGKSLVSLINDILDFSKLESGKFSIHAEPFNFGDTVDDVVSLMGYTAREKNLELVMDMPEYPQQQFIGDSGRLRQVLLNLLGNALKFTTDGHVKFSVSIRHKGNVANVQFSVTDTGVGISDDKIDTIFQQFAQADNSSTRQFGGTGLGLTISQQLVQLMGGNISVKSILGSGSQFSFSVDFPVSDIRVKMRPTFEKLTQTPILVVDDIAVNHLVLSNQLEAIGATPICVSGAATALKILKEAAANGIHFPLVISDYQMPSMNGLEFVQALRNESDIADTPVMMLSSVDLSDYIETFSSLGVEHIYVKPCLAVDLNRAIFEILAESNLSKLKTVSQCVPQAIDEKTAVRPDLSDRKIKILAADDDEINRVVITQLLGSNKFDLTITENGQEAVEKFKQDIYDVILMDISMPVMDGIDATKEIRKIEAKANWVPTPIIATTAHALPEDKLRFIKVGMNERIAKPIDKVILREAVNKWALAKQGASKFIDAKLAEAS